MKRSFLFMAGIIFFSTFLFFLVFFISIQANKSLPHKDMPLTPTQSPIDGKSIRVPEPNGSPPDADTAVPAYTYDVASSRANKIRVFNIKAENDKFYPSKIIVNLDDIVRIYLTSIDKPYDLTISKLGNSREALPGETKLIEFQAVAPGEFAFSCRRCIGDHKDNQTKVPKGVLLVVYPSYSDLQAISEAKRIRWVYTE